MNLQTQFEQELTNLGSGSAATVAVDATPRRITCDVVERNSLAISFDRLQLATSELAAATVADLQRISTSLSGRLTYLMEPISPIEIDAQECVVQLRSNPPQKDDDGRSYYELIVRRGGEIALVRYRKENGTARRQIPATVTREVLLRLVGDFCSVLGENCSDVDFGKVMLTYEQQLDANFDLAMREGSMYFEGSNAVHKTLRRIAQRLDELGVDYAVAGGMCLFRHGFQRFTRDVDVIVTREGLAQIHDHLEGRGYVKPFAASKNLRDAETGVRIDFIISGQYPGEGKPGPIAFPIPNAVSKEIDGIRYVDLVPFIELKLASGQASHRAQDLHDVQQLIVARSLPRELAEQVHPSLRDAYLQKWNDAQKSAADDF